LIHHEKPKLDVNSNISDPPTNAVLKACDERRRCNTADQRRGSKFENESRKLKAGKRRVPDVTLKLRAVRVS
jgi:hypothetical protein